MRKIKIKLTAADITELCALLNDLQHRLVDKILLDTKEIDVYRMDNALKLYQRMRILSIKRTFAKMVVVSFSITEQITLRYCLLTGNRNIAMQNLFMILDRAINPSIFERHEHSSKSASQQ